MDMEIIVPVALFVTVAVIVLGLARTFSEGRTRRHLIESGNSAEIARIMGQFDGREDRTAGALKWGVVAVAAGAALVLIQFLPYQEDEPIVLGLLLLFVGAGLLVYHQIARRGNTGGS